VAQAESESTSAKAAAPAQPELYGARERVLFVVLAVVMVFILFSIFIVLRMGIRLTDQRAPIVNSSYQVRYLLAEGHVWLEEYLMGDRDHGYEDYRSHSRRALEILEIMLEGGHFDAHHVHPVKNDTLRTMIGRLRGEIGELNQLAEVRVAERSVSGVGSPLDMQFDAQYQQIVSLTTRVDNAAHAVIHREIAMLRLIGSVLLVVAFGLAVTVSLLLRRHLRRRQEALGELAASQRRYRDLVETMQDMVYRYQLVPEPRFQYVSPAAADITGYTPEELYDDPRLGMEIVHEEDRPDFEKVISGEAPTDEPFQVRWVRKDGKVIWTENRHTPIRNTAGEIVGLQGISRDITKERTLEQQLLQAQKMESIGRLAGGIAHDFNNLLTGIGGNVDFALEELGEEHPAREDIQEIGRITERAARLTNQLLAFSRKQILAPEVLSLNVLLEETKKLLLRLLGEDVRLELFTAPDLWAVKIDPAQFEQIVINLAVNARDAMPDGGMLTLETANVTHGEGGDPDDKLRQGDYVMIAVSDTGTGIEPELLASIFEPFFTTKKTGKGTGLGLATVHGIVRQHGGEITVYSEPGEGTTFKIYFPRVDGEPAEDRRAAETALPSGEEAVLVVEDSEAVRGTVVRTLSSLGYKVHEAASGEQALQRARGIRTLHALITDVVMPGLNGVELERELRRIHPDFATLFMSGFTENAIVHRGVLDEGIHFIPKPFRPIELARKLRRVLDEERS
jgi:PAS domain S-box-containing protein